MSNNAPPLPSQPLDVLEREQLQATAALQATLNDLWSHIPTAKQVMSWAEENPLLAAGAAAGVGAVAGALVTPSSRPVVAPSNAATAPRGSLLGSMFGQALPMLGMAISEAGRNMLLASLIPPAKEAVEEREASAVENTEGDGI